MNKILQLAMQKILHEVEEGIHIIDDKGITLLYNSAMEKIEGLDADMVIGRHLLDVFPNWTNENSTLLTALKTGKPVSRQNQSYLNFKGKMISTVNTTYPIYDDDFLVGAVEIATNFTEVSNMSEQIVELQRKLMKPQKELKEKKGINKYTFDNLIGMDKLFLNAVKVAKKATESSSSVLVHGETGTGKELFAQSIHYGSSRSDKPFIAQNCAALPENLLESILFGTTKGSFTGAVDRPGLFEQAEGGTLFLDEINSMEITLQGKLLRVLQERYIRRVGGTNEIPVNVRIIAASNEDPFKLLDEGIIRRDLFYRINVINVGIPSLRERNGDIKILVDHFLRGFNEEMGKDVWMLSKDLEEAFMNYSWSGNIRELRNFVETAMNLVGDEHVLSFEHIPHYYQEMLKKNVSVSGKISDIKDDESISDYLMNIEREIIESYMVKYDNNISRTSQKLKISRQNLQYKLKKYNLT